MDDHDDDVVCVVAASSAWPFYGAAAAYVCQPHRTFRDARRLGFYSGRTVHGQVPVIRHVEPAVAANQAEAARRSLSVDPVQRLVGRALTAALAQGGTSDVTQVVLLSPLGDPETAAIDDVPHDGAAAWTMFQRYATLGALRAAGTTADLEA